MADARRAGSTLGKVWKRQIEGSLDVPSLEAVDDETSLIERWIVDHPYLSGPEESRIQTYGVPVWALVGHQRATLASDEEIAASYELPIEAVRAARHFYLRHASQIDARLAENAA